MNKKLIFVKRPIGIPQADCWSLVTEAIPSPAEGEVLIEQYYISLDPAMRGWLNETKSYISPVKIGDVMRASSVGQVVKTNNHPYLKVGDYVCGSGGVQQYCLSDGKFWFPVDPQLAPLERYLSTLGMTGMTAYFGILEVGKIKEGETVLISAAAGAVGSIAAQIAKLKSCKVIGIAGSPEKCKYLEDTLKLDDVINYKKNNVRLALKDLCPEGIDVYFDNVGGDTLDAALASLRKHARVVICGAISQYNNTGKIQGPSNYLSLLVNRATMQGMVVFDWMDQYPQAIIDLMRWINDGKIISREDVYDGIDNFYPNFLRLFTGEKKGKLILKVIEQK
jgi:NADPH-dependent curcumin reductase CurA